MSLFQCTLGHWDWPADDHICWTHRGRHEPVIGPRLPVICLWCLWCFCQTLGCEGGHVRTDLHWPRVWHQCHLCKTSVQPNRHKSRSVDDVLTQTVFPFVISFFFFLVLPEWQCLCHRLWWRHLQAVWSACGSGINGVLSWQHHMWHHLCCFLQERPSSPGRIRRLQLQRVGHTKSRPRRLVTGSVLSPQPPSLISWSTGSLKVVFFFQVCWLDMTTALAVWELLMMEWQLQQDPGTVFWRSGIEARRFFCFVFSSFFKKKIVSHLPTLYFKSYSKQNL